MNPEEAEQRQGIYDKVFSGEMDTWDYQWGFAKLANSGLSITPNANLISNIGFGADATHTSSGDYPIGIVLALVAIIFLSYQPPNDANSSGYLMDNTFINSFCCLGSTGLYNEICKPDNES